MKVLHAPTTYLLEDHHKTGYGVEVVFVHRNAKGELVQGITNEEVVEMLLQRFYEFQKKSYSSEGDVILKQLQIIKKLLNMRIDSKNRRLSNYKRENAEENLDTSA